MSYTNIHLHIVFGTKGRYPFINKELKKPLIEYLGGIVRGLGGVALEINAMPEHVHLLVKIQPTIKIADFVRDLKSNSSKWAKQQTNGRFAWQRRYAAFSVSESQVDIVRRYIRNQEKHHATFDFKAELEKLLQAHGIEIDEYLWKD